jgi:hypothetical protein
VPWGGRTGPSMPDGGCPRRGLGGCPLPVRGEEPTDGGRVDAKEPGDVGLRLLPGAHQLHEDLLLVGLELRAPPARAPGRRRARPACARASWRTQTQRSSPPYA